MENRKNRFFWFEQELRKELSDSVVDYKLVESRLFSRILEAEKLGGLSVLKMDEMLSLEKLDQLSKDLFSYITQFKEYEEPINDCIKTEQDPQRIRWDLLELKLERSINEIISIPEWEQILKSSEQEYLSGEWEKLEKMLFSKINYVETADSWVPVLKEETIPVPVLFENSEEQMNYNLKKTSKLDFIDQVLLKDQILPQGKWEKIEDNLLKTIEAEKENLDLEKQPFWHIIANYVSLFKKGAIVVAGSVLAIIGLNGYRINSLKGDSIPTVVYQLQGEMAGHNNSAKLLNGKFNSVKNGRVTLVNNHGIIELEDQTDLYLSNVTENCAHYKVNFDRNRNEKSGTATFIVKKRTEKQDFRVYTPDYEVVVKGTYFRVEPDQKGHISTKVFEGSVKIESTVFGDTILEAGQSIVYDHVLNRYRIRDGGTVIRREEVMQMPSIDELLGYQVLRITSNISGAEVKINGKFVGFSPLVIRQPTGLYHISVAKNGFSSIDTTVNIIQKEPVQLIEFGLEKTEKIEVAKKPGTKRRVNIETEKPVIARQENVKTNKNGKDYKGDKEDKTVQIVPEIVAQNSREETLPENDETEEIYLKAQKFEKNGRWQRAIKLYEQIFDNQTASKLRREDALFSIGRLKADNGTNIIEAQKVFLNYLANFPDGSYSGESWLRLAELEFLNSPENSIQYYLKYFEKFPHHPRISELQNRVGAIYLQQKKYNRAVEMFRRALYNLDPSKKEEQKYISTNLHKALQEKGDTQRAEQVWNQYLANVPENP